ncbi:hypothetical protein D1BOALGB6SA_5349 [Olavius sp. associated proteobacterium Delta 1]|nr:hypothetical protein D1BOALGB6SA_5349 [Olavius sp. associated proteobacterium Delta 1]
MNWVLSRFPDEIVIAASACRRSFGICITKIGCAMFYRSLVDINGVMIVAITLSAKRIAYLRFHPETANLKYPYNPVNPV